MTYIQNSKTIKFSHSEESTSDDRLKKMKDLVSQDVLLHEEGLIFQTTTDSYNKLERTSKTIQRIMKKVKAPRSVYLNENYWENLRGSQSARKEKIIKHLENATQKCSIVKLVLPHMGLYTNEPNFLNILTSMTTLQELDLSMNSIEEEASINFAFALTKCQSLMYLHLQRNGIATEIPKFAQVLSSCPVLTCLDLSANGVQTEGAISILQHCISLKTLTLSVNIIHCIQYSGQDIQCTGLQTLDLSFNFFTKESKLHETFKNFPTLSRLDLSGNNFSQDKLIYSFLPQLPSLTHLNLSQNQINDQTLIPSVHMFPQCSSLTYLDLSRNEIRGNGLRDIFQVLPQCASLKHLDLSFNLIVPNEIAIIINDLPQCTSLTSLDIRTEGWHVCPRDRVNIQNSWRGPPEGLVL